MTAVRAPVNTGPVPRPARAPVRWPAHPTWRFAGRAMASPIRLSVCGVPLAVAEAAWAAAADEFERSEEALSRFRDSSDLTRANRAAAGRLGPVAVDRRLVRALVAADRARRSTGGRFDSRVLRDLDRLGYRGAALRDPDLDAPAGTAGSDRRVLRRFGRSGEVDLEMPVDLGGIGKGLALRWAMRRARELLPAGAGALLEAGGDVIAAGPAPEGGPWRVGIEEPRAEPDGTVTAAPLAVVAVADGAVATSSVRIRRWTAADGRTVHHLIDPWTGAPGGDGLLAVTVAAPDPAWAEVWSKALFLEGPRGIAGLARSRGLAAWWVRESGEFEMTPAARLLTDWVAAEA